MSQEASVIEAVAKYFYFLSLDERLSFAASLKVLAELKSHNWLEPEHRAHWVGALHRWQGRLKDVRPRPWTEASSGRGFLVGPEMDLGIWSSFLTAVDKDEREAVILSRVSGFTDEEIAVGLGVTVGTVRYRVGRGLRHLGGFLES